MRLNSADRARILAAATEQFGPDVAVLLFGDRLINPNIKDHLADMFYEAVRRGDDESAEKFLAWIFHNVNDRLFAPILVEEAGKFYFPSDDERVREAKSHALKACALSAMELWRRMPSRQNAQECAVPGPEAIEVRKPAILETLKFLLMEVADCWRETGEESISDAMFQFLCCLDLGSHEEEKVLLNVIRDATGLSFPEERLVRHILSIEPEDHPEKAGQLNEIRKILAIALARNSDPEVSALRVGYAYFMSDLSKGAHRFIERLFRQVQEMENNVEILRRTFSNDPPEGYEGVPCMLPVNIRFVSLGKISIVFCVRIDRSDSKQDHEWINRAKRNILKWQELSKCGVGFEAFVFVGVRRFYTRHVNCPVSEEQQQ